jgi:hypothetical protein
VADRPLLVRSICSVLSHDNIHSLHIRRRFRDITSASTYSSYKVHEPNSTERLVNETSPQKDWVEMKFVDLTIPIGIATPPWPTYEPLQLKYFKRLAPNGANGQVLTHSNHVGTHLDGEIHFHTSGKDIASLKLDYLIGPAAIVDLSDIAQDYDV